MRRRLIAGFALALSLLGADFGLEFCRRRVPPATGACRQSGMTGPPGLNLRRRYLFYDSRISVNGKESCASCHRQELAFTDGRAHAEGTTGQLHPRSSMSLVNVAYAARLTWANPQLSSL